MTTIGQGVIELSADGSKLKAGVEEAKRSIRSLGAATSDMSKSASNSIDRYVKRLETQSATLGKSTRETELYKLALRGANKDQIAAADSALRLSEAYEKGSVIGARVKIGLIAAAATAATIAVTSFANALRDVDKFNDLNDATGASVENISALDRVARETGSSFESVAATLVKYNAALNKAGEDGKPVTDVLKALGLSAEDLKNKDPAQALLETAKAFQGFERDGNAARAAQILFGKSIQEVAPLLKDLAEKGKLTSTISTEAAQSVETFNKQIFQIRANAVDAARALTVSLLPAITSILKGFQEIPSKLNILGAISELKDADAALKSLESRRDSKFNFAGNLDAEITKAKTRLAAAKKEFNVQDTFPGPRIADASFTTAEDARLGRQKKQLKIPDPDKPSGGGKDTAGSEAKARLALELEIIRNGNDSIIATYANAEKIIESMRSANLLSDREYYDAKRGFLNLNSQAQDDGLSKELARLKAENLSGKDRIDNDRKILDVQAKLAKLREGSVTGLQVLQISENAYFEKLKKNYTEAETAARNYLDTLRLQQDRETAGLGKGNVARDRNAGIAQNEDKFAEQRSRLEQDKRNGAFAGREDDYQKDLALIRDSEAKALKIFVDGFDKRIEKQKSWQIGASEALKNYADNAMNTSKQVEEMFANAFKGLEDGLVGFAKTGKLDFKSLADSIISDLIRIQIQQSITKPLANFIGGSDIFGALFGGFSGINSTGTSLPTAGGRAIGGPVSAGQSYLVGERGPEIFTPNVLGGITPNGGGGMGGGATNYYFNGQSNRNEIIAAVQIARSLSNSDRREEGRRALQ